MLLCRLGGGLSVLFVEDAENGRDGFLMDEGLAVYASNVGAKFLIEFVRLVDYK